MILVHHKVLIVPLKIVRNDIDLTRVVLGQGVCLFEKISQAMFSFETGGSRIVFGFGHGEIGHVLFLGPHGFYVEKHVQGRWFIVVIALVGPQGLKTSGSTSFGGRTPSTLTFSFELLFLLFDFSRREGFFNETPMGMRVDVLMAGGAVNVTAPMTLDVFESHFQFTTAYTSASIEADAALMDMGGFSFVGFASMGFETRVSEKVPTSFATPLRGFQTTLEGTVEIGEVFADSNDIGY